VGNFASDWNDTRKGFVQRLKVDSVAKWLFPNLKKFFPKIVDFFFIRQLWLIGVQLPCSVFYGKTIEIQICREFRGLSNDILNHPITARITELGLKRVFLRTGNKSVKLATPQPFKAVPICVRCVEIHEMYEWDTVGTQGRPLFCANGTERENGTNSSTKRYQNDAF